MAISNPQGKTEGGATVEPVADTGATPERAAVEQPSLAQWLDAIAKLAGYESGQALVATTGVCCWMDYFNDGYSPEEAWAEECDE